MKEGDTEDTNDRQSNSIFARYPLNIEEQVMFGNEDE